MLRRVQSTGVGISQDRVRQGLARLRRFRRAELEVQTRAPRHMRGRMRCTGSGGWRHPAGEAHPVGTL
jgi:hypothetical protein